MNINQIVLSFSELFKTKKVSFHQIQRLVQSFYQLQNKGPLFKRLAIISNLCHFYHEALINEVTAAEKFKFEVFFAFLKSSSENTRKSTTTAKKIHNRGGNKKKTEVTINQILEQAVSDGLNQLQNLIPPLQPIQEEIVRCVDQKLVILPPFDPEMMAQLTQKESEQIKTPQKEPLMLEWEPNKLQNYQKWLALTQQGINVAKSQQKVPRTKKKVQRNQETTTDDRIDVSQGLSQLKMLESLATKVKASRQLLQRHERSMQNRFQLLNPVLTDINGLSKLLQGKVSHLRKKGINFNDLHVQRDIDLIEPCLDLSTSNHKKSQELGPSTVEQINSNNILQQKLRKAVGEVLSNASKASFSAVCKSKQLLGESKGEIFHQLLYLNLRLDQKEVPTFGQIYISAK